MDNISIAEMARVEIGTKPSPSLISRIKNSYRLALSRSPTPEDSTIWLMIGAKQTEIHEALLSDDDHLLMELLSDPQSTNLYYGVDNLAKDVMEIIGARWKDGYDSLKSEVDNLLVALGEVDLFNRHGGARYAYETKPETKSVEEAIEIIDGIFGGRISFPNPFSGEFGIATSKGLISYRTIQAVYQSILVRRYAAESCLEIGGGMGRTAFFGHLLGLKYTIIDLPMTIVGQALFLASVLGDDAIWLLGDTVPKNDRIVLLPPSELHSVGQVDIVLNVDSLTEMGEKTATDYLAWISENCETFVSINHEANLFKTMKLCQSLYPSSLRSRCPYWLRAGYVEEVFSFDRNLRMLKAIQASSSWRLMQPLRRLVSLFR
ncbi:putative sugar O-methyltransferase [Rhizobium lusitanum]|uniref:putative sugar O-methyltransferase n=1 Tax=Rhizobium lusitanum TaxID=293958 RepID=UPI0019579C14|nr:putative sugar O-methyltransferase [Rhizobium lusitanum]MBM7044261.1 putative sugar O-methyltransferase [Rhizobium lusitanum]